MLLPNHGKISCRKCFANCTGDIFEPNQDWRVINDPGAWGGSEPEVLILGFSKGSTQANIYQKGKFADVAFGGGARERLNLTLKKIGFLTDEDHVSEYIEEPNSKFAFGSLVRCSLTRMGRDGNYSSSGPLVVKSFKEVPNILDNCAQTFIANLPRRTKTVLMLGITDAYIDGCFKLLSRIYPKLQKVNDVSYGDGERIFVHIAHPSPGNGHFSNWIKGNIKFEAAMMALSPYFESTNPKSMTKNNTKERSTTGLKAHANNISKKDNIMKNNINSTVPNKQTKNGRIPVSTIQTGCIPFNKTQISKNGYRVGENPIKTQGDFIWDFEEALDNLRSKNTPGWRDYGNTSSAHKGIAWVTPADAQRLLNMKDKTERIALFKTLEDVVEY
jgi:hypothetical protein